MIQQPKNPMPNGFNLDDFVPSIAPEDAQAFGEALESADLSYAEVESPYPPKNAAYWKRKAKRMENDRDEWRERYQRTKINIQAALGNGIDQEAWKPSEKWVDAACRNITENRK